MIKRIFEDVCDGNIRNCKFILIEELCEDDEINYDDDDSIANILDLYYIEGIEKVLAYMQQFDKGETMYRNSYIYDFDDLEYCNNLKIKTTRDWYNGTEDTYTYTDDYICIVDNSYVTLYRIIAPGTDLWDRYVDNV